jgi:hypothetical protein
MATLRLMFHRKAENTSVRAAVGAARAAGHRIDVRVTREAGDGVRPAEEASQMGVDFAHACNALHLPTIAPPWQIDVGRVAGRHSSTWPPAASCSSLEGRP